MDNSSNISSLKELKERNLILRQETEYTKKALVESLETSRKNTGDYLLKHVALPVGGAILTLYVLKKIVSKSKHINEAKEPSNQPVTSIQKENSVSNKTMQAASTANQAYRKNRINFNSLLNLGRIAIPAAQAIAAIVKDNRK